MKALVLAGGGAKGAYEVGVWKALRKMGIKFDIVTGTSIGSLVGMFVAQNEFYKCLSMWKKVNFDFLFDDFTNSKDIKDIYLEYFNKTLQGGLSTTKMQKILNDYYNPDKLYNSNIKYGLVAYNVSTKKEVYATNLNTRPDKLKDFIVASCTCFPVFKSKEISGELYIDGAYYDNIPINLAIDLGATDIIVVDLGTFGNRQKIKDKSIPVKTIKPSSKLDSFLLFEQNNIKRMIEIGYNDTLKEYKKCEGNTYTFKKGTTLQLTRKFYNKFNTKLKKLKINKKIKRYEFLEFIETIMEDFKLDVTKIYNYKKVNDLLKETLSKTEIVNKGTLSTVSKLFKNDIIIKELYTKIINKEKFKTRELILYTDEILKAVYLETIRSNYEKYFNWT